jgi:hypothetical protein
MYLVRSLREKIKIHQPKLEENRRLKMAERRMFAKKITESDAFLDMPSSTQMLYFHLSMNADDDGFVNNPKKIQRMCGASDDDFKLLLAKSFVLLFESGVIVIKHWKMHNYIQADRYRPTDYVEEKSMLGLKKNKAYTLDVNKMDTKCIQDVSVGKDSIGKVSLDKNSIVKDSEDKDIKEKDIDKSISKKKTVYYPDDEMLESAFQEYLTMRKKIKKPICTDMALHRAMNTIERLSKGDNDLAVKILNQSVDHCWQGLFALKDNEPHSANKGIIDWDNV